MTKSKHWKRNVIVASTAIGLIILGAFYFSGILNFPGLASSPAGMHFDMTGTFQNSGGNYQFMGSDGNVYQLLWSCPSNSSNCLPSNGQTVDVVGTLVQAVCGTVTCQPFGTVTVSGWSSLASSATTVAATTVSSVAYTSVPTMSSVATSNGVSPVFGTRQNECAAYDQINGVTYCPFGLLDFRMLGLSLIVGFSFAQFIGADLVAAVALIGYASFWVYKRLGVA